MFTSPFTDTTHTAVFIVAKNKNKEKKKPQTRNNPDVLKQENG